MFLIISSLIERAVPVLRFAALIRLDSLRARPWGHCANWGILSGVTGRQTDARRIM